VLRNNLKTVLMPFAMVAGGLLHRVTGQLDFLTPWLLFTMLFIPFCGVRLREMRLSGLHINLLLFQAVAAVMAYMFMQIFDRELAQGAMICLLAPTATAAVVVSTMLGARVSTILSYSLLVNGAVAVGAPLFFAVISPTADISLGESFLAIFLRVIPILVLPFVIALLLRRFTPKVADTIRRLQPASFYVWLLALAIATGRIVDFVKAQAGLTWGKGLALAGIALVLCVLQFLVGHYIGRRYGEPTEGSQLLGQKNTILAIWMAQTYLNPVASIAPAAYILWQNLINSVQLWRKSREDKKG
jgi:BASS family bile acid:Na+ symporter